MKLPHAFDPTTQQLPNSGDFFPETGYYPVRVTKTELKATKANQANWMLVLTLTAIGGAHAGRSANFNLNIMNQNTDATAMAYRELAAYCTAMGINHVLDDTDHLLNKPFGVSVVVSQEPSKNDPNKTYTQNTVKTWHYADGHEIVHGQFGGAAAAPAAGYAPPAAPAPVAPAAPVAPPVAPPAAPAPVAAPVAPAVVPAPVVAAPAVAPVVASPVAPAAAPPFAPPAGAPQFPTP